MNISFISFFNVFYYFETQSNGFKRFNMLMTEMLDLVQFVLPLTANQLPADAASFIELRDSVNGHFCCRTALHEDVSSVDISFEVGDWSLASAAQSHVISLHHRKNWTLQDHRTSWTCWERHNIKAALQQKSVCIIHVQRVEYVESTPSHQNNNIMCARIWV